MKTGLLHRVDKANHALRHLEPRHLRIHATIHLVCIPVISRLITLWLSAEATSTPFQLTPTHLDHHPSLAVHLGEMECLLALTIRSSLTDSRLVEEGA